jgi:peptidoglycan/xylan/chitin deacetylase (PgdA/CDA1 family)
MIPILISAFLGVVLIVWLMVEYSFFIPPTKGIPVLMYHKVSESTADGLSVPEKVFESHLEYLRENNYQTLSFSDLVNLHETGGKLPSKPVILTFDDAYADFAERALPMIRKFHFRATVFIPVGYMGKINVWDMGSDPIMNAGQIKTIAMNENIEFGLHSFLHRNYAEMSPEDMRDDLSDCTATLNHYKIPFVNVLAYPYGGYPKHDKILNGQMKNLFREKGLKFALRIGNRINGWPLKDPYEIKRIDIKGTDNYTTFKIKLRKGRKKLFS